MESENSYLNADRFGRLLNRFEAIAIFLVAAVLFNLFVFTKQTPNISMLFDSTGYLNCAKSVMEFVKAGGLWRCVEYFLHGCSELDRVRIIDVTPGILELVKTGPVVPLLICFAAVCGGKSIDFQHWSTFTEVSVLILSATVMMIYLLTRALAGRKTALLAAFMSLLYSPFYFTAGRVMSEPPAAFAIILCTWLTVRLAQRFERQEDASPESLDCQTSGDSPTSPTSPNSLNSIELRTILLESFLVGCSIGFEMLARPQLAVQPILMILFFGMVVWLNKRKTPDLASWVSRIPKAAIPCMLCGIAIVLVPWAATKQILTGSASVSIDRNPACNIAMGLDPSIDGWDVPPWTGHPEQYPLTVAETINNCAHRFVEQPIAGAFLLLRKPTRLFECPWNDYQQNFLWLPFSMQRIYHQGILLLALAGVSALLSASLIARKPAALVGLSAAAAAIVTQCVTFLFITMSRYFFVSMPVVIVLSAIGARSLKHASIGKQARLYALLFAVPLMFFGANHDYRYAGGFIPEVAELVGIGSTALSFAIISSILLFAAVWKFSTLGFYSKRFSVFVLILTSLIVASAGASTWYQIRTVDEALLSKESEHPLEVECVVSQLPAEGQRLLLAYDASVVTGDPESMPVFAVSVNGKIIQSGCPLWLVDKSMRENLQYTSHVAHASNCSAPLFRQWRVAELGLSDLHPGLNHFSFRPAAGVKRSALFADFPQMNTHNLDLTVFSWNKATTGQPGEMRTDRWRGEESQSVPRLVLVVVDAPNPAAVSVAGSKPLEFRVQEAAKVTKSGKTAVASITLADGFIREALARSESSHCGAVRVVVSGQLSSDKQVAQGSLGLLEGRNSGVEEFAPLAPIRIPCGLQKRPFSFEDVVVIHQWHAPLLGEQAKPVDDLKFLRLIACGTTWWDVLQYGTYKGDSNLVFSDLKVVCEPFEPINLVKSRWHALPAQFRISGSKH